MANPLEMPILISQLPTVSKWANAEMTGAEIRQDLATPQMVEQLEKERQKTQEVQKTEQSLQVDREKQEESGGQQQGQSRRRQKEHEEEEPTLASNASPWTGNIVNKRI